MDINELATTSENVCFEQQPCCDFNTMEGRRWSDLLLSPLIQAFILYSMCAIITTQYQYATFFYVFPLFGLANPLELLIPSVSLEMVFTVMCLPDGLTCFFSPNTEELQKEGVMHPDFHAGKHCTSTVYESDSSIFILLYL